MADIDPKGLEFFNKLFSAGVVNVNDLGASAGEGQWRKKGLGVQDTFTHMVDTMRDPAKVPLKPINDLMSLVWDLVGKKVIPTGMVDNHPMIKSLTFYAEVNKTKMVVAILVPSDWPDKVKKDPCMQMGALVYVGSQARDHWNLKLVEQMVREPEHKQILVDAPGVAIGAIETDPVMVRARGYESEFLHWVKRNEPNFEFNDYQRAIMKKYPGGLKSVPAELAYEGRPGP